MRVKHRERKDDDNDIIFQCGWYRGILRDFAPEKHLLFRGFLYVCEKSERKDFIFQKSSRPAPYHIKRSVQNMEFMTGVNKKETLEIGDLLTGSYEGKSVKVNGAVHTIRDMGEVAFIVLRKREGLLQCVYEEGKTQFDLKKLKEAAAIEVEGTVKPEERAPHGFEIRLDKITVLSEPAAPMPLAISKWKLNTSLEANLNNRAIALRNVRERAKFRIQEGVVRGFRDFLYSQGFTEIHTPKIGAKSAEGGANLFRLEYFHRPAILQQSPQFYKQMMVGVFDRVFETAPVFRA